MILVTVDHDSGPHVAMAARESETASGRLEAIRPLIRQGARLRTHQEVDEVAGKLGKSRSTIYRWIKKCNDLLEAAALVRRRRSDCGTPRLSAEVEAIVRLEIDRTLGDGEVATTVDVWRRIVSACDRRLLDAPNLSTVRRRRRAARNSETRLRAG